MKLISRVCGTRGVRSALLVPRALDGFVVAGLPFVFASKAGLDVVANQLLGVL